ncbi:diacylglycerol kinase [Thiohalocapsa marina]|uniref:Diacylglycerol kinase n=1 Tax=Thiohalocapsa marina TaxID=424902 RepID=A0A5M8FM31_9GAMM|nr:diacylglycerol kinase [Thiohalocapsa marina]KAA6185829.1 diacylglycerol kinase [Thiohalocapsa marina]
MANGSARGGARLIRAFGYSMMGLQACFRSEAAFRQELFALIPLIPLGLWLGDTPVERALLLGSLWVVLIVELLNSAIEANVDRVGLERHELSKRAKDIASAAVFTSLVFVATIWGLILLPKWF